MDRGCSGWEQLGLWEKAGKVVQQLELWEEHLISKMGCWGKAGGKVGHGSHFRRQCVSTRERSDSVREECVSVWCQVKGHQLIASPRGHDPM